MGKSITLDINKLNNRIKNIISTEDALKDVTPINWSNDIVTKNKQVTITKAEKDCDNKCVKLEILS